MEKGNKVNCRIIGSRIRQARKARGFTQEKLGRLVGADGKYVSRLESGRNMPSITKLVQISRVLDMSCDFFIRDIDVGDGGESGRCCEICPEESADMEMGSNEWEVIHMVQEFVESIGEAVNLCRMPERYK